ncbi:MAG: hypothetical protein J5J00_06480 [Deltaproteobacteria bacterium]|nr:hypothetical protein [Deltaproteobacteria bacterium]
MAKRIGIVKRILGYAFMGLVLLLLFEWGLYALVSSYRDTWNSQIKPTYSWSLYSSSGQLLGSKRGVLKLILRPYITYGNFPNQKTEFFTINSDGLRGESIPKERNAKSRVLLLGGSAAFGTGLSSDSETLAAHLAAALSAEVINAAVIGHQSGQELSYFASELVDYRPDVVLVLDGWNDFIENRVRGRVVQTGDVGFHQIEQQLVSLTEMTTGSPFYRIVPITREAFIPTIWKGLTQGLQSAAGRVSGGGYSQEEIKEAVSIYTGNHLRLNRLAKGVGSELIIFLQPDARSLPAAVKQSLSDEDRKLGEAYLSFTAAAHEILKAGGIRVLDFREYAEVLRPEFFMDHVHINSEGNKLLADIAADFIRKPSAPDAVAQPGS